jgi:hypothetical protein
MTRRNIDEGRNGVDIGKVVKPEKVKEKPYSVMLEVRTAMNYILGRLSEEGKMKDLISRVPEECHSGIALELLKRGNEGDLEGLFGSLRNLDARVAMEMLYWDLADDFADHIKCFGVLNAEVGREVIRQGWAMAYIKNPSKFPGLELEEAIRLVVESGNSSDLHDVLKWDPKIERTAVIGQCIDQDKSFSAIHLIKLLKPKDRLPMFDKLASKWVKGDVIEALDVLYPKMDIKTMVKLAKGLGDWFRVADLLKAKPEIGRLPVALALVEAGLTKKAMGVAVLLEPNDIQRLAMRMGELGQVDEASELAGF